MLNFLIFCGCKPSKRHLIKIEGKQIAITDSLTSNPEIEAFVKPYRDNIEKDLDSVLAFSADTYTKNDGDFNTALGNFMADAVYEEANPIFNKRTGIDIDMVLLNHGGIRSILPKGKVTKRTAFQLMPFENSIVIVALKGKQANKLVEYLSRAKRAHPVSKLQLILDQDFNISKAKINNKNIVEGHTYYVATNDYLYNGGDGMSFFKPNDSVYVLNYKIRNALIDHFKRKDTIAPLRDNRFIQEN
ncbi:5'-nucleotidase C-terminal domain-containing protein [Tamlana crocina]|uniref:5'-nucleotidase C-terminal domain-containing protein n=1 Tax=Tamlana crocina TaxID=393006 RepID=UPI001FD7A41C|nr:5'-nucleotidase [Tamlana crocina]